MNISKLPKVTAKCILVGDAGVGKSSILNRILRNDFNPNIFSTIGVEFGATTINMNDDSCIKLQIWDAAGQERFRSIVQSYYRNAAVVVLVFDLTDQSTLDSLATFWIDEITRIRGIDRNDGGWPLFYLIGNKADLSQTDRTVFPEHIEPLTRSQPIRAYREVSAKNGSMIDNVLQEIAMDINANISDPSGDPKRYRHQGITLQDGFLLERKQSHNAVNKCC